MPSPVNPFPTIALDLGQEQLDVLAAFTNAETELTSQNAPTTYFLDIYWDNSDGRIKRTYDNAQVGGLSDAEQKALFPQLNGLFVFAMNQLLYP